MAAARFTRLESLTLDCCSKLDSNGLRALVSFPSLRTLSICADMEVEMEDEGTLGKLAVDSFEPISSLTSLTELYLDWTTVDDEDLHAFSTLTALQTLSLHDSVFAVRLEDAGLKAIASLTALTDLDISREDLDRPEAQVYPGLTDVSELSTLVALTALALGGHSQLTDEGIRSLSTLTALTLLNVADCESLTDEGVRAVFPRVTIERSDRIYDREQPTL
eukprot:9185307-Pyramimonas_sp.AAC.1